MIPIVERLLARVPEDHPHRQRIADAGARILGSLKALGERVAAADAKASKETARRLRQILDHVATGRPIERVAEVYSRLRALNFEKTPWRELNAVLEEVYGEAGLDTIQAKGAADARQRARRERPPAAASVNKRPSLRKRRWPKHNAG